MLKIHIKLVTANISKHTEINSKKKNVKMEIKFIQ